MTAPVELPTIELSAAGPTAAAARPVAAITRERYAQLAGRVKLLSWLSLAWMTVEGRGDRRGIIAGSIALIGFGLDSTIEGFASVIIVWRFTGQRVFSHAAEQRAQKHGARARGWGAVLVNGGSSAAAGMRARRRRPCRPAAQGSARYAAHRARLPSGVPVATIMHATREAVLRRHHHGRRRRAESGR